MAPTFISYRRDDSAGYAGRLHEELAGRLGRDQVFRDADTLLAGQDFVDAIQSRLRGCSALVALIGRGWLNARDASGVRRLEKPDDYVALEIAAALERPDVLVIPVLVGGASMPPSAELPPRLRALGRRHAFTIRDETWDADVDRLAALLTRSTSRRPFPLRRAAMVAGAIVLALIAAIVVMRRDEPAAPSTAAVEQTPAAQAPAPASAAAASERAPAAAAPAAPAGGYAIDVPGMAEVAHGGVIYTLISGNVHPRGATNGVRLRFRVSNESAYDANLWDASFRLAIGDTILTPTSGLNEIAAGRSIRHAIVTFTVPAGTSRTVLRIMSGSDVAELLLDLSPTGRPIADENADSGDALSRARTAWVVRDPRPLVAGDGYAVTLTGITSRLFVNKLRIRVGVRYTNEGRYPIHSGVVTVRLGYDDEVAAPVSSPNAAIDGGSTSSGDFVFEIPPASKKIELRASAGAASATLPLEVR